MKLAEALNLRADLQKRVAQLRERITNNMMVQEGDKPAEEPSALFAELGDVLLQLEDYIVRINKTNQETAWEGRTITEMIAEKDVLTMHLSAMRSALEAARMRNDRYTRNEIKFVRTVNVAELQQRVDTLSKRLRELDTKLQQANWMTDLL